MRIKIGSALGAAVAALTLLLGLMFTNTAAIAETTDFESTDFERYASSVNLSGEHADVFRLYWAFFDRPPDLVGASYWVGQYDQCVSLLDVTWSFSASTEFKSRYGNLTNSQYVDLVYSNVLGRAPDTAGRQYWVGLLESGELIEAEVMLYFSLGDEFKLRRPLPSDGRAYRGCTPPAPPVTAPPATTPPATAPLADYYANCDAVKAAGAAPLRAGEPGYRSGLDRDGDGIACET